MQKNQIRQKTGQRLSMIWLVTGLVSVMVLACLALVLANRLGITSELAAPFRTTTPDQTTLVRFRPVSPTATSTSTPRPTPTITPTPPGSTPVAVAPAEGWTFEGVRLQPDPGLGGLTVYGEAINSSGAPQRILGLQAALYDSQGQALNLTVTDDYWPIETVPTEGRVPFELTILGPAEADRVDLQIATEPGDPPRTDFELAEVEGVQTETEFCVRGQISNPGQPLTEYVMVVAVLYDDDDRVINWGIGYEKANVFAGEESVLMSACAERFNRIVARHELRAWGL